MFGYVRGVLALQVSALIRVLVFQCGFLVFGALGSGVRVEVGVKRLESFEFRCAWCGLALNPKP